MLPSRTVVSAAFLAASALFAAPPANAYRPFDGTDAAVAEPDEFEIELGPAGVRHENGGQTLVVPAIVLNLGVFKNWEAVLQGQGETRLSPHRGPTTMRQNGAFLKGVLREGVLQGGSGPSIATEFGVLLPDVRGESDAGGSLAAIVSQRWSWFTAHFNAQAALAGDHEPDYFVSAIFEGPFDWTVRPVGEVFYDWHAATAETTVSGLVGAIWKAREDLSFDVGLRDARVNNRPVEEIRLGLTYGFSLR
jgi:hypothetical protein